MRTYSKNKLSIRNKLRWDSLGFFRKRSANHSRDSEFRGDRKLFAKSLMLLWYKQRGKCAYTGIKLFGDSNTHLDHIIPRTKGGSSEIGNLQFVCSLVNRMKFNLSHEEFLETCKVITKNNE
jgi:5-methylcytosine-specific restriction endonuclease McrA